MNITRKNKVSGRGFACALLAASSLGCSALRAPLTCPEKGGPRWTEIRSSHFLLHTDLDPEIARARLTEFEATQGALSRQIRRSVAEPAGKVEIILFEREEDFYEVAGQDRTKAGYFTARLAGDVEAQPVMVMPKNFAGEARETFQHELAHRLLHLRFANLPTWLNEGLAQYYSTFRVEAENAYLGGRLINLDFSERPFVWEAWYENAYQLQIPAMKAPTVRKLLDSDATMFYIGAGAVPSREAREQQAAYYAGAWKLVQLLLNGPDPRDRVRFEAFLSALERGGDARAAFLQSFGEAQLPRLEAAFRDYLTEVRLDRVVFDPPAPAPISAASERFLSDPEVHLLWARLLPWKPATADRVRAELDEALRKEPGSPEVHFERSLFFTFTERLDDAQQELTAALQMRPDEPRYLFGQILLLRTRAALGAGGGRAEIPKELFDRLARVASSATELNEVAWSLATHGRADEALPYSERAIRLDPLCWNCQDTQAFVLFEKGRLEEALRASDRAVSILPEKVEAPGIRALHRRIEEALLAERRAKREHP
jgi:tetratricopeptide (TPR) repeat protein